VSVCVMTKTGNLPTNDPILIHPQIQHAPRMATQNRTYISPYSRTTTVCVQVPDTYCAIRRTGYHHTMRLLPFARILVGTILLVFDINTRPASRRPARARSLRIKVLFKFQTKHTPQMRFKRRKTLASVNTPHFNASVPRSCDDAL
jgi:hypothetical protein